MSSHLPFDWETPDFSQTTKVHDWKNYVGELTQAHWPNFTDQQKQDLARDFQTMADREEWD